MRGNIGINRKEDLINIVDALAVSTLIILNIEKCTKAQTAKELGIALLVSIISLTFILVRYKIKKYIFKKRKKKIIEDIRLREELEMEFNKDVQEYILKKETLKNQPGAVQELEDIEKKLELKIKKYIKKKENIR